MLLRNCSLTGSILAQPSHTLLALPQNDARTRATIRVAERRRVEESPGALTRSLQPPWPRSLVDLLANFEYREFEREADSGARTNRGKGVRASRREDIRRPKASTGYGGRPSRRCHTTAWALRAPHNAQGSHQTLRNEEVSKWRPSSEGEPRHIVFFLIPGRFRARRPPPPRVSAAHARAPQRAGRRRCELSAVHIGLRIHAQHYHRERNTRPHRHVVQTTVSFFDRAASILASPTSASEPRD